MRKHVLIRLAALVMALLLLLMTPALAATCTLCGSETGSDDYLCTSCLLNLLHQEREVTSLEITGLAQNEDGTVALTWSDEAGNAPYTVRYELLEAAPVPFGWTAAQGLTDCAFTLDRLVPGVSYVVSVQDSLGQTVEATWYAPTPDTDTQIGAKIGLKAMHHRAPQDPEGFSASEIAEENDVLHGLYVQLTYGTLARTRYYTFHLAVTAPNGFSDVVYSGKLELRRSKSYVPAWSFIHMDDYFSLLQKYYGGIPTGEYNVTLYFNGNSVWSTPFTVRE